jgi:hypothetical protein
MRPITVWMTAVVTVVALWLSNEANLNGVTGKAGDNGAATAEQGDSGDHTPRSGEHK